MRSKQQLMEIIGKTEHDRRKYLMQLFEYVPDVIAGELNFIE